MPRPPTSSDDELLERAMWQFWARGWSGTSIRELEAALELRAPSIYRRLGPKDELYAAALDRYVQRVVAGRIGRHLGGEGDPVENLWAFVSSALRRVPHGAEPTGCLLNLAAGEAAELPERARPIVAAGLEQIDRAVRREVERAALAGRLPPDRRAEVVAEQLTLGFHGLLVLARSGVAQAQLLRRARLLFEPFTPTGL